jgi:CRISPR-associated protein Cas5t
MYRTEDGAIKWLIKDNRGLIGLPIWIDRTTTQGTFQRFSLSDSEVVDENCWIEIKPPN